MAEGGGRRALRVRMTGRDIDEAHRASSPLELLFDLTFVVAVGRASAELAHSVAADKVGSGIESYLMVFFAIWWAWMNFTWFASAYDTDDVGYRLLTLLQMAGVLVLTAGVLSAFEHQRFGEVVVGYLIMRVSMVAQWLRAAASDPERRRTARRYAGGILIVQFGWVLRLLLPDSLGVASFVVLAVCEMAIPLWAERPGMTTWHPHHIAERYGLFTIIVLGECVLAASTAIEAGNTEHADGVPLAALGIGSLVLLFGLWWLYYLRDVGDALHDQGAPAAFRWGYAHFVIFAALAAIGAGIEVAAEAVTHTIEAPDLVVAYAVAVPVSIYLLLLWFLHRSLVGSPNSSLLAAVVSVLATLAVAGFARAIDIGWVVGALGLPTAALVAFSLWQSQQTVPEPVAQ